MSDGFFGSKYFVIAAAIAVALVAGGATAYYFSGVSTSFGWNDACRAPALAGSALAAAPSRLTDDDGKRREETWTLDAASYAGGTLDLCVSVGEIVVEPSPSSRVELQAVITGDVARAVEQTEVAASFRADAGSLVVGAWEAKRGQSATLFGEDSADVRWVLRVPETGAYEVHAVADVGDVHVSGIMISDLDVVTDVGNAVVTDVDLTGDATLTADVGDTILHALSVQSGNITVTSDVGNAEAQLPSRADVGYDATASTDVGDALVRIGDAEAHDSSGDGPSERETARSVGFASKPTRVVVHATTDVGDARITTG